MFHPSGWETVSESLRSLSAKTSRLEINDLSGCSTGLNVVAAGDELIGLARGLLHAGAQSLVLACGMCMTEARRNICERFTAFCSKEGPKRKPTKGHVAAAGELSHPYQWAPFI